MGFSSELHSPVALLPAKKHWRYAGPRASLDDLEKRKKSHVTGRLEHWIVQAVDCFVYWLRYTGSRRFLCIR